MDYKYIKFNYLSGSNEYDCINKSNGDLLASIIYYEPGHRWVLCKFFNSIFDSSCLYDIVDFLNFLDRQKKEGKT